MSTQEKSGGTLSSAFTKGEYTYMRRDSAVATGDIRITDPKPSADLNIVMDPQPFPRRFLGNIRSLTRMICNQRLRIETWKRLFSKTSPPTFKIRKKSWLARHLGLHWSQSYK